MFEFDLDEEVHLVGTRIPAMVEGRAEYSEANPMYLVRYLNLAGEPKCDWLYGSQLTPT